MRSSTACFPSFSDYNLHVILLNLILTVQNLFAKHKTPSCACNCAIQRIKLTKKTLSHKYYNQDISLDFCTGWLGPNKWIRKHIYLSNMILQAVRGVNMNQLVESINWNWISTRPWPATKPFHFQLWCEQNSKTWLKFSKAGGKWKNTKISLETSWSIDLSNSWHLFTHLVIYGEVIFMNVPE